MSSVKNFVEVKKMHEDVAFSDVDINGAMMEHASLFAYYTVLSAKASHQLNNFKMLVDLQSSKIDKEIRDNAAAEGIKLTEAKITNAIKCDARYVKAQQTLNEASMASDIARGAVESFRHRRDMLVQIGKDARDERSAKLAIAGYGENTSLLSAKEMAVKIAAGKGDKKEVK
tara:strand:- start:99919 stop:100434 length:516 start_codon:yes stop_codon:yes gene_type:complete